MLGAVIQTGSNIAGISGPARVAVALAFNTFAVATATLTVTWTSSSAVIASPTILTSTNTLKALAMARAVVRAGLFSAIVTLETLVTLARHLRINGNALSVA